MLALASFVTDNISPHVAIAMQQAAALVGAYWILILIFGGSPRPNQSKDSVKSLARCGARSLADNQWTVPQATGANSATESDLERARR